MRTCYICLPIAGREHDIFERAEQAKQEVIAKILVDINLQKKHFAVMLSQKIQLYLTIMQI